jgi:DNA mismatch endonuclease, patch repair protein
MQSVRRRGTKPELCVRRVLSDLKIRYRVNVRGLPGSPDIANAARHFAIFVHGCFWHRHPGCRHASTPATNGAFWEAKFEANVRRDRRKKRVLREMGYRVLVVWECQASDPSLARRIRSALGA